MIREDLTQAAVRAAAEAAARQIAPLWPLSSSVAVNPFLGQSDAPLAATAARLGRAGGVPVTMPRDWYLSRIETGAIDAADLEAALSASPHAGRPAGVAALLAAARAQRPAPQPLPTVADRAAEASGIDWPGLVADRIGAWAAGWTDAGQALWPAPRHGAWASWRSHASHDLTPEIAGLGGFCQFVTEAPQDADAAIARAAASLGLTDAGLQSCFHRLLMSLGGWAQLGRYRLWQADLAGGTDRTLTEMLAIRLLWEEALFRRYGEQIADRWAQTVADHASPDEPGADDVVDEILQEAAERASQRRLAATLAAPPSGAAAAEARPDVQALFCIDVRSEVFRRALESVDPGIRTHGAAGFFGVLTRHHAYGSVVGEARLPVLVAPPLQSRAGAPSPDVSESGFRSMARARRAWGRFKLAAVSSLAFVEAVGPVYAGKLLRDALGLTTPATPGGAPPRFDPEPDVPARIAMAEAALRGMSLTGGFARLVLIAGHGAQVTNNAHAAGLQCGACGGHSGEVNARLLAGLLNDPAVRTGLAGRGLPVPADTLFVAALHDTTTDRVTLFADDAPAVNHAADLTRLQGWLAAATARAGAERALSVARSDPSRPATARAADWAEIRPEWGLAGCHAFIAAPRHRTAGRDLAGRAFLHDYSWRTDAPGGYGTLEMILTAPVVVASWISLHYYGAAVAPQVFGSGNKLLHNVVGGIGVVEGNGGLLRAGLPWQSVHDGDRLVHDPLRLSVCVEAPTDAMSDILSRHPGVRALFDNRWLHLFAMDESGQLAQRYAGDLRWQAVEDRAAAMRKVA